MTIGVIVQFGLGAGASAFVWGEPQPHREPLSLRHHLAPHSTYPTPTICLPQIRHSHTMRITAVLLSALYAVTVTASPSWMPGQVAISEDYKVPGDNPLHFCADPKDDILEIKKVDLSPNPPSP